MAEPRSFAETVVSTAKAKLAAAHGRQYPDNAAEKPRDAILDGLQMAAASIAEDGYIFSPSGPKFVRKNGDLTFQISAQSDRNNTAGQRAAVWVHASVYSRVFTAWSRKHSSSWIRPNAPFPLPFYSNQLGYLCEPAGWTEWDFVDRLQRRATADDLICSIRCGAYPLFAAFEGETQAISRLVDQDLLPPDRILGYLLSVGQEALAREALQRYLDRRPRLAAEFAALRQKFTDTGLPNYRKGTAHDLAAFAVATGYPWES